MVNYQNGKIYKIISGQTNRLYIGSTVQPLCKRRTGHITYIKRGRYISSEEILQYKDAKFVLIERYPCNSKEELFAREQYWIDQYKAICCNNRWASGKDIARYKDNKPKSDKKYYKNNSGKIKQRNLNYYKQNADKINKKVNCDNCNAFVMKRHMATHKKTKRCQNYNK